MTLFHATCVSIDGAGVLITGPSGCGKSDLALRLLHAGALLVADDQVELTPQAGQLIATCPPNIEGLIEARGVGLLKVPTTPRAPVALVLSPAATPERLPLAQSQLLLGCTLPLLALNYLEASTPVKVLFWLRGCLKAEG